MSSSFPPWPVGLGGVCVRGESHGVFGIYRLHSNASFFASTFPSPNSITSIFRLGVARKVGVCVGAPRVVTATQASGCQIP